MRQAGLSNLNLGFGLLQVLKVAGYHQKLPCYVFCICLLTTNIYQKYKSVEFRRSTTSKIHCNFHNTLLNPGCLNFVAKYAVFDADADADADAYHQL